jgi:hypothetical protein
VPAGKIEPQDDLTIVDLPGGLKAESLVKGPRFTIAWLGAGEELGGAVRADEADDLGECCAADAAPLAVLVDEQFPQEIRPFQARAARVGRSS